jgi:hypothetical protein
VCLFGLCCAGSPRVWGFLVLVGFFARFSGFWGFRLLVVWVVVCALVESLILAQDERWRRA